MSERFWLAIRVWAPPIDHTSKKRKERQWRSVRWQVGSQYELMDHLLRCRYRNLLVLVQLHHLWQARTRGIMLWRSPEWKWMDNPPPNCRTDPPRWKDPDWVDELSGHLWAEAVRSKETGTCEYLVRVQKGDPLRCVDGIIKAKCPLSVLMRKGLLQKILRSPSHRLAR